MPGTMLAKRFALVQHLGQGAMGDVWLAEDTHLDNDRVACKILYETLRNDRKAVADMNREILMARRLRHPHVVGVYTFWDADDAYFITMQWVQGANLAQLLADQRHPFPLRRVLPWTRQLADALDHAHDEGILHRDIKPANILLDVDDNVLLSDFGIACAAWEGRRRAEGAVTAGTVLYMSPEQLSGGDLDRRSDLYGLASTLYTLLSGAPPFCEPPILHKIQFKAPLPIGHLTDDVNAVLLKALAKTPQGRYPSCLAFSEALHEAAGDVVESEVPLPEITTAFVYDTDATTIRCDRSFLHEPPRLGDMLVRAGLLDEDQLSTALDQQQRSTERLGTVLVRMGILSEIDIAQALAEQLHVPFVSLTETAIDAQAAQLITRRIAQERMSIPIARDGDRLVIAIADPLDLPGIDAIEEATGYVVELRIATESDIAAAIDALDFIGDPA